MIGRVPAWALIGAIALVSSPVEAQSPRDLLTSAAFATKDKAAALAKVEAALREANAALKRNPDDHEALLQQAIAIGYRGKLKRDRADAKTARRAFDKLAAANPRDAEAQLAIGGWHLAAIVEIGPVLARTVLGARKAAGLQGVDRAVALGGGRALFPAYASLLRISWIRATSRPPASWRRRRPRPAQRIRSIGSCSAMPLRCSSRSAPGTARRRRRLRRS